MYEDLLRSVAFPLGSLLVILGVSFPLWSLTSWLELRKREKATRRLLSIVDSHCRYRDCPHLVSPVGGVGAQVGRQELSADPPPADHRPPPPPGPPAPLVFLHPTREDAERFTRRAMDPRFDAVDLLQKNPRSWPVAGSHFTRLDQWAISSMIDRAIAELGRSIPVTREEVERQEAEPTEEAPAPGVPLFNFLEGKYPPVPYLGNDTSPHLGHMAYFLLSCPFCLAPFEEVELTEDPDGNPIHRCGRCGCLGPVSGNDQTVSWENRKPLSQ